MEDFHYFLIDGFSLPFGYIPTAFVQQMSWSDFWALDHDKRTVTLTQGADFETRTELM